MTKAELYDRLLELTDDKTIIHALCDWFDGRELEEFVNFLEKEKGWD